MIDIVEQEEAQGAAPKKPRMEPATRVTFVQDPKRHPLAKTLKRIDKTSDEALEFLAEVMRDVEAPLKERMTAAQFVVDRKIQIANEINKDNLSRMVAEARLIMAQQPKQIKQVEEEGEDTQPRALFNPNVILDVNKCTNL